MLPWKCTTWGPASAPTRASAWRGDGLNTSAPNLAISNREVVEAIISIAQHASPNVSGQMALLRAQLNT
jgi:hypothetical protein